MIGQFGSYNEEKQIRDFRSDFFGVEVCSIKDDADIDTHYSFTLVLEFDAVNKYIHESDLVEYLSEKYPHIRLCLDIGR